jgi:hypothetical protein
LIRRLEPDQAETTLGVVLAPDGNTIKQAALLKQIAEQWADNMRAGKITRNEA